MKPGLSHSLASEVLAACDQIAEFTEEPGKITRTFLCPPMHALHAFLTDQMRAAGMSVRVDSIGNLIGRYPGALADGPVFLIGSHLDSVPDAGKYDGVLGVVLGIAAVGALAGERLPFAVDVIGFSEEEGIRFGTPYLGSRALAGCFDTELLTRTDRAGISLADALRQFGLDAGTVTEARYPAGQQIVGYLETHIEQGPILEAGDIPLGAVEAIVGQCRCWLRFDGRAGHAGTLPMDLRQDALSAAAEFVLLVEEHARAQLGLRATVGMLSVTPGAVNVVPGSVRLSLDIRHADDTVREKALAVLFERAHAIARRRGIVLHVEQTEPHPAVRSDHRLTAILADSIQALGIAPQRMVSGAGHDAAVMAGLAPTTMLFLRSLGGISHHPDEAVNRDDVQLALEVMVEFLHRLAGEYR